MSWAIWITGPPASGKSAIAGAVTAALRSRGRTVTWLELDEVRASVTPDPRYTEAERDRVYRALGYMATLLVEAGRPVIIDATAHRRVWRDLVRAAVPRFAEVQLMCPIEVCREREQTRSGHAPRNIYARAGRPGATVPGVDVPYEVARAPELLIDTTKDSLGGSVERVVGLVEHLEARSGAPEAAMPETATPAWAIWITGRPGAGNGGLAARVLAALRDRGRHVRWLELAEVRRRVLGDAPPSEQDLDLVHRALGYAAKLLTEAGTPVIVDARGAMGAERRTGPELIPHVTEIEIPGWGEASRTGPAATPTIEDPATAQVLSAVEGLIGRSRRPVGAL